MQGPLLCVSTDYGVTDRKVVVSTYEVEDFLKFLGVFSGVHTTDKRTDVLSRDFIIRKINSGLWAVV